MYINKISIPLSEDNFKILYNLASDEIANNFDFNIDYDKRDIIINIYDKLNYFILNNHLKSLNIFYDVLGIKGDKEDIIEAYHHLIN